MSQLEKDSEFIERLILMICENGKANKYKVLKSIRLRWLKNKSLDGFTVEWHYPKEPKPESVKVEATKRSEC